MIVPWVTLWPKYSSQVSVCASSWSSDSVPVALGRGAQQRQRDGVVAAEAEHARAGGVELARGGLDRGVGRPDVDRVRAGVAGVDDLRLGERRDAERLVVGPQQDDASRIAAGPKRAPGRNDVPPS